MTSIYKSAEQPLPFATAERTKGARLARSFTLDETCTFLADNGSQHLFWLNDRLAACISPSIEDQILHLAEDGSSIENHRSADIIDDIKFEDLADYHEWLVTEKSDDVEHEVIEIMSTFEPSNRLPFEFKESDPPSLSGESIKYMNFAGVIKEYAAEDPAFMEKIRRVIDLPFRAETFFRRISERTTQAFNALDDYIKYGGPTHAPTKQLDVPSCAAELKLLVNAIDHFYQRHMNKDEDIGNRAGTALITILSQVTSRDVNAYANTDWGATAPQDPRENNLFYHLIGSAFDNNDFFALEALLRLPRNDVVRNRLDTLREMGRTLEMQAAPAAFMTKFNALMNDSKKRAGSDAEGQSAKRSMIE
jgi:hypothetical protein